MNALPPNAAAEMSFARAWGAALLIAAVTFAALAPTLRWSQFTNGNENIVTQTALEMRHGGPKLVPAMMGEPRVKKPPLVAWITALAMRPATLERLDDPKERDAAYVDLAWQVRWTGLLAGCLFIVATFEFTRVIAGGRAGVFAAMAAGTNYLFFKYMRQSTTDVHLTLWVTAANACSVHGLVRGRWWLAATCGALATGLAFLCKGPVALVETVLPLAVGLLCRGTGVPPVPSSVPSDHDTGETFVPRRSAAFLVGVTLFAVVALPWFIHVYYTVPHVWDVWFHEVTREGATDLEPGTPLEYLLLGPMTVPWLIFGIVGLGVVWKSRHARAVWLPIVFAVVPLLVMVWFKDRKERYLLPMMGPACAVCGMGVAAWVANWRQKTWTDVAVCVGQLTLLTLLGVALFLGGRLAPQSQDLPHFPTAIAVWGIVAVLAAVALAIVVQRRWAAAVPVLTFSLMLGVTVMFQWGYSPTKHGRSPFKPMAETILTQAPGAAVYDFLASGNRVEEQLPIYLNHTVLRADPATIQPNDHPVVMVLRQNRRDPVPTLPQPWTLLSRINDGPVLWYAFVQYPVHTENGR